MSVDRCSKCGALVDTDDEPEAYVEVGNMRSQTSTICLCQTCRERYEDAQENKRTEPPDLDERIAAEIAADPRYNCENCDWDVDGCSPCPEHSEV